MGIVRSLFSALDRGERRSIPIENPAVPLSSPALWQWLTGGEPTAAGETVNEQNALQIVTVYRCVRYIAEAIASLPLEVSQRTPGGHIRADDDPVNYLLAVQPNPEMSPFSFKETLFGCASLTGNGYAQIERNAIGEPLALWPLHPFKTKPVRRDNQLMYETGDGMALGQSRIVPAEDVIHIRLFSFDGILGLSPIGLLRQSLGLTKATEKFGGKWFGNGSRPGGVIFNKGPKPDPKVQKEITESWNREHGGTNQGRTAFLFGGEWDYKQIGLSPEDSQFLATRSFQRTEIAAAWGLHPSLVGDVSKQSGTSIEQQNLQVLVDTLRPYLVRGESEFNRKLFPSEPRRPSKSFCKFDPSARLAVDFKTQQEGFAAGVQWGWYSPNDVRKKLGENPGPAELDVYRVPVNMAAAKTLLKTDEPDGDEADAGAAGELQAPTSAERKLLGVYTRSFVSVYGDAFGRLAKRSKRDAAAVDSLFRPVLRSLAGLAIEQNGVHDAGGAATFADGAVADVLKSMEKRAAKWPADIPVEELEKLCAAEFLKAVRSIHIATSREWAGVRAAREVENNEA